MKTNTLRKFILAGSLGLCSVAVAAPSNLANDNFFKSPEITRPVLPRITPVPVPLPRPGPTHPVQPIRAHPTAMSCLPIPAEEKATVLPRPFPMPDFTVRHLLTVTGNDGGCVIKPGKPPRPRPNI